MCKTGNLQAGPAVRVSIYFHYCNVCGQTAQQDADAQDGRTEEATVAVAVLEDYTYSHTIGMSVGTRESALGTDTTLNVTVTSLS